MDEKLPKFTSGQFIQEKQYDLPYHHFIKYGTKAGNFYFSYIEKCVSLVNSFRNKKVLDAGCGDGYFLWRLDDRKNKLFGIDYSEKAVEFAKIFNKNRNVKFSVGELEKIPFPNNFFDIVVCISVLEHIKPENIDLVLENIRRILKPGGSLILAVPTQRLKLSEKHFQHFTPEDIKDIASSRFEIAEIMGAYNFFYDYLLKLFDNRFYDIKFASDFIKGTLFYRYFSESDISAAKIIIAVLNKK
jgi:ubiquinone/menaquinone biosynthesis C-methylase UbiE